MPDKFSATWVSHSSMSAFIKCPRAYFLGNVYRDPNTRHKVQVVNPALALGQCVHEVLESLSVIPTTERFKKPLLERYEEVWKRVTCKGCGFQDVLHESTYKERGAAMLRKVVTNPGPLAKMAVKIKADLPHYWLSPDDEIILCGKIDWLEYMPEEDAVHIVDFKTGRNEEDGNSLQLPIYHLLVHNTQARKVSKVSYWYLESSDEPVEKTLPDLKVAHAAVLTIAKQIKLARKLEIFKCPQAEDGCFACKPFEKIVRGEAEFIGESEYHQDMYVLPEQKNEISKESDLL